MSQEEVREEYARFKQEWPNVYARLLEINKALGAHGRSLTDLLNGRVPSAQDQAHNLEEFLGLELDD